MSRSSRSDSLDSDDIDIDNNDTQQQPTAGASSNRTRARSLSPYKPPHGMQPLQVSVAASSFEYDELLRKQGAELWAIRVPANLKANTLSSLSVSMNPGPTGSLTTKSTNYTLSETEGSEMGPGMRLLVPRKRDGKLLPAPKAIRRHLYLAPSPHTDATPTPLPESRPELSLPPKRSQPSHLLAFRNRSFGFDTPGPTAAKKRKTKTKTK